MLSVNEIVSAGHEDTHDPSSQLAMKEAEQEKQNELSMQDWQFAIEQVPHDWPFYIEYSPEA